MSDQYSNCKENIISQLLKVQAQVTVTPLVKYGTPKVYCIESNIVALLGNRDRNVVLPQLR